LEFASEMLLSRLERIFLQRLASRPWISPPAFDHKFVARLIKAGYVQSVPVSTNLLQYEITEAGRGALDRAAQ
jgi:hypothetical protein